MQNQMKKNFIINDNIHCEIWDGFETFTQALEEIQRRCSIPWDQTPNVAPCRSWKTCGRQYSIHEYLASDPSELVNSTYICEIRASGTTWYIEEPDTIIH